MTYVKVVDTEKGGKNGGRVPFKIVISFCFPTVAERHMIPIVLGVVKIGRFHTRRSLLFWLENCTTFAHRWAHKSFLLKKKRQPDRC